MDSPSCTTSAVKGNEGEAAGVVDEPAGFEGEPAGVAEPQEVRNRTHAIAQTVLHPARTVVLSEREANPSRSIDYGTPHEWQRVVHPPRNDDGRPLYRFASDGSKYRISSSFMITLAALSWGVSLPSEWHVTSGFSGGS